MAAPIIRFSEFAVSGVDPAGSRHLTNHGSYVKQLGTAAGQTLDFGALNLASKQTTDTKAVVAMVDNMNEATSGIYNMKFWISDSSDWTTGTYSLNAVSSGTWIQDIDLTDASGYSASITLPSSQNWWRQDHFTDINGISSDDQVTEYMYVSITADTDVPVGVYGGSNGNFTYRLTYDYR